MLNTTRPATTGCAECRQPFRTGPTALLSCGCAAHFGCWEQRHGACAQYGVQDIRCGVCWGAVRWVVTVVDGKRKRGDEERDAPIDS